MFDDLVDGGGGSGRSGAGVVLWGGCVVRYWGWKVRREG